MKKLFLMHGLQLLHQMNGSGKIYEAITEHRERLPVRISDEARKRLSLEGTPERMEWMRKKLAEHEILSMTILDTEYPDPLRKIPDPPGILFYQGEPRLLKKEKRISMVGSRAASYSGLTASKQIAAELSRNGVTNPAAWRNADQRISSRSESHRISFSVS